jgi:hypothetical protein
MRTLHLIHEGSPVYHTLKNLNFPVPSWNVTNQTLPGLEKLIQDGDGKIAILFYSAGTEFMPCTNSLDGRHERITMSKKYF